MANVRGEVDGMTFWGILAVLCVIFALGGRGIWRHLQREHPRNCRCYPCWERNLQKAFRMWEKEEAERQGKHPRTCGCRPCFARRLRSGGIP